MATPVPPVNQACGERGWGTLLTGGGGVPTAFTSRALLTEEVAMPPRQGVQCGLTTCMLKLTEVQCGLTVLKLTGVQCGGNRHGQGLPPLTIASERQVMRPYCETPDFCITQLKARGPHLGPVSRVIKTKKKLRNGPPSLQPPRGGMHYGHFIISKEHFLSFLLAQAIGYWSYWSQTSPRT